MSKSREHSSTKWRSLAGDGVELLGDLLVLSLLSDIGSFRFLLFGEDTTTGSTAGDDGAEFWWWCPFLDRLPSSDFSLPNGSIRKGGILFTEN